MVWTPTASSNAYSTEWGYPDAPANAARDGSLAMPLDHMPEDASPVSVSQAGLIRLNGPARAIALDVLRVKSLQTGAYVSHFRGRGMEFDESRPYQPGDDPRSIDWRVTARSTTAYTKLFREERD